MKAKKAIVALGCAGLLVAGSVAGTLAFLTSTTEEVTNTFTVGNVKIELDEAKVNEAGKPVNEEGVEVDRANAPRVKENDYHLYPAHTYTKDPIVHVANTSDDCWVFVKVVDEIAAIQDSNAEKNIKTVAEQMADNNWVALDNVANVYYYNGIVTKNAEDKELEVFASFKIKDDLGNTDMEAYGNKTITVNAYAVQADGFTTAAAAWEGAGEPDAWKVAP